MGQKQNQDDLLPDEPETDDENHNLDDILEEKPLEKPGIEALRKERKRAKDYEAQLRSLQEQYKDIDLEEYKTLKEQKELAEQQKLVDEKRWEELSKRQKKEIAILAEKEKKWQESYQKLQMKTELHKYYAKHGGIDEVSSDGHSSYDVMFEAIAKRVKRGEDGSYTVYTHDGFEDKDEENRPKTLDKLIEEYLNDPFWGRFFAPKNGASGGGMMGSARSANGKKTWEQFASEQGLKISRNS
jgi:hypothetical protein